MSIESINIKNFTVFDDININFSTGINILLGENGTGKTHLLKLLYSLINVDNENVVDTVSKYFQSSNTDDAYFTSLTRPDEDIVLKIHSDKYTTHNKNGHIQTNVKTSPSEFQINHGNNETYEFDFLNNEEKSVYIPAKDMLTHSEGFISLYNERYVSFDKTYYDIINKSLLPDLKSIPKLGENILPKIENFINGKVIVKNNAFYIQKDNGSKVKFSAEAEGLKKLSAIWKLIMNGSITENSILFWDEPEANMNPKILKTVAEILLELSRNGVQIFLATHNYIFAKYLEVLMDNSDKLKFHSLYKINDKIQYEVKDKFSLLANNSIREENINLYNAEINKEME